MAKDPIRTLVRQLDRRRFRAHVRKLASFQTRYWSTAGNEAARDWIQQKLESFGYEVERHEFTASGRNGDEPPKQVENIYATKIGSVHPENMYIVSAHMDSFNAQSADQSFAPGANDDASGTALVLEVARVLGSADVTADTSIRFILWNAEEIGLVGSRAYVQDRRSVQGVESPPGSGEYPEPRWLGIIQHDMLLYDHGMPGVTGGQPADRQIEAADIDIEFDADETFGGAAIELAATLLTAKARHAARYPAEVGQFMQSTDSVSFAPYCPAVSVRENERRNEIGQGSDPQWHKNSDVVATYRDEDFRLGFTALQMTTAAVAMLTGVRIGEGR